MLDTVRKTGHGKLPVSPGMYRSSYMRDYEWCNEYKALSEEDKEKLRITDSQLKAKEFAVPWEEQGMTCSDSIFRDRREVIPALNTKASSHVGRWKPEGIASCPKALQQRMHFPSVLPAAKSYQPKYSPATQLAVAQAEKLERLQALAELENKLSYCQGLPAAAQSAGTTGMLLPREKVTPSWATYQQFIQETHRATQRDAQQNMKMILGSSVLVEEGFDHDWRSVYNRDFQLNPGPHGGYHRKNYCLSHVFPKGESLNRDRWVSEYKDSYSIFLRRLNWSSQIPALGLCSGKGMHTAQ